MDTRTKIIIASTDLFLHDGIKSITMDDVARNIGISKRTLYENFDNKRTLIIACLDYIHTKQLNYEKWFVDQSNNIIEELFYMLTTKKKGQIIDHKFSMDLKKYFPDIFDAEYKKRHEQGSKKLRERLQRGVDQGIILADTNIDFSVFILSESIFNIVTRPDRLMTTNVNIDDAFRFVFISFFRGIATAKGVEMIDKMKQ